MQAPWKGSSTLQRGWWADWWICQKFSSYFLKCVGFVFMGAGSYITWFLCLHNAETDPISSLFL